MSDPNSRAPFPGTYWVVPGQLLAGQHPGGPDDAATTERLTALLDAGIHSVINLLPEDDPFDEEAEAVPALPAYEDTLEKMGESRGLIVEIERLAIEDANTLTEDGMELILDAIDAEIDGRSSPTFVHCSDGNARTGIVVGCYLARHGLATGEDALAKIRELRSGDPLFSDVKSPETMVEEKFVLRWRKER